MIKKTAIKIWAWVKAHPNLIPDTLVWFFVIEIMLVGFYGPDTVQSLRNRAEESQRAYNQSLVQMRGKVNDLRFKLKATEGERDSAIRERDEAKAKAAQVRASPVQGAAIPVLSGSIPQQINQYRVSQHLPELRLVDDLNATAQAHSNRMANGYGHNHSGYAGEIIGFNYGYADPFTRVVQDWINSPGHRAIMLCSCSEFGVGVAQSGTTYWFTGHFR